MAKLKGPRCNFRFLLVDPRSDALGTSVGLVERSGEAVDIAKDVEITVERLGGLLVPGQYEIRYTQFAPPFSLVMTDVGAHDGKISVELFGYRISPRSRPHFILERTDEPWYRFFRQQFDQLWEDARLHSGVQIIHIEHISLGSDVEDEHVEIENYDHSAVDMASWTLKDKVGHSFRFPEFKLDAGALVKVWTKKGTHSAADLYWGLGSPIWDSVEDTAYLRDAEGDLVDTYRYRVTRKRR